MRSQTEKGTSLDPSEAAGAASEGLEGNLLLRGSFLFRGGGFLSTLLLLSQQHV